MQKIIPGILTVLFLVVPFCGAVAQEPDPEPELGEKELTIVEGSHLTVAVKMSYANLMVNSEKLKNSPGGFGVGAELDYTHFVTSHIGLRVGLDFAVCSSSYSMMNYSMQSSEPIQVWTNIEHGESMTVNADYHTTTNDVQVIYTYTSLGVPVGLALQGEHWYAMAGAKFYIPLKLHEDARYGETQTQCVAIGNNTVSIPAEHMSRQVVSSMSYDCASRDNTFTPFFATSLIEAGYRLGRSRGDAIGLGVYAEFSFNECHPGGNQPLVSRSDGAITTVPTLRSDAVKSMRIMNVGLKLLYDFSFRHPRKR